jgi:aminoglycoside phosphotransferase (APT) family kinase protein
VTAGIGDRPGQPPASQPRPCTAADPGAELARYLAVLAAAGHAVGPAAQPGGPDLRSGQFHDVVLTADVAYRFPRDEESRRLLPSRVALLTVLSRWELPVSVPVPVDTGQLDRPLGSCYVALTRLSGAPADPALLDDALAERAVIAQLAGLLDQLSRLGADPAVRAAVPAAAAADWADWAAQVRSVLFPLMSEAGRRRAEAELAGVLSIPATGAALVHADLGGANLLFETRAGSPVLTGILDWDGACIGNQANDVASLAATFGWPTTAQVQRRRSGPGAPMTAMARKIAATFALQQALPAALSGDAASLDDGLVRYR